MIRKILPKLIKKKNENSARLRKSFCDKMDAVTSVDKFILMMDPDLWRVTSLRPHATNGILVVMQAIAPVELFDDIRHKAHVVDPYDYVVGYLTTSHPCCMKIRLHAKTVALIHELTLFKETDLEKLASYPSAVLIDSSLPECTRCTHFTDIERRMRSNMPDLIDSIEWYPGLGVKYHAMIEDPDFKKRWNRA